MITKGTSEYKKAQKLANLLTAVAAYERFNNASSFNLMFEPFYRFIRVIKELGTFASQVANTIDEKCNPFGFCIARLSSKQAWVLACAAIENNIEF